MVENCRRQHCQLMRARNAYFTPANIDASALCVGGLRNFCINKNKMVA